MSISGNLEDVSVAEVLQFVHIGRRTGTLVITSGEGRGEVGFHRGRIISAWSPNAKKLGDLLLAKGLLERPQLDEALRLQESQRPRRSLGKILVDSGLVRTPDLRKAVADQIEETVYQLVTWRQGSFEFAIDELRPVDDIGVYPGDILPDINLNTQMLVLEALRIFDEKNRRDGQAGPEQPPSGMSLARETDELFVSPSGIPVAASEAAAAAGGSRDRGLARAAGGARPGAIGGGGRRPREGAAAPLPLRVHLLSGAADLSAMLADPRLEGLAEVVPVDLVDAGLTLPGQSSPVVVTDLRDGAIAPAELASLLRTRPHASVVAVVDSADQTAGAYAAGALAAVPAEAGSLISCLGSVARERREVWATERDPARRSAGFARLRRVVADLRSGLLSATVALNLMNVISESVERAIMFLVRDRRLVALGAFGSSMGGVPLARLTSELEIELRQPQRPERGARRRSDPVAELRRRRPAGALRRGRRPAPHRSGRGLPGSRQQPGDLRHLYRQRGPEPRDRGDRDPRAGRGAGRSGLRERVAAA